jgi:hypothetical protein
MNPKLTNERLKRRAIVYLRQSSPEQVFHNQESQRRQNALADQARELGFRDILVIDEVRLVGSAEDFSAWLRKSAPVRSAPCFASRLRDWRATATTGTA